MPACLSNVATKDACVLTILAQVRALQRAHRAGINPQYGQLEELFETADHLERQLEERRSIPSRCVTPDCANAPMGGDTSYAGYCDACAAKVIVSVLRRGAGAGR